ncbi:hypothetical protein [Mycobacteroides abscessus]|uniref:hypothetical protein n=1 Tax=Mycobacteroides abscessus TaxID=36809 RepID=UPI0011C4A1C7|nr:hypothetical protein [Mycobacteroides abscessus]
MNDHSIAEDKIITDSQTPAARVYLDQAPPDWASWLSDGEVDIPPGQLRGTTDTGLPTDGSAVHAGMPYTHDFQTSQVTTWFAFTLTGIRNNPVRVTSIKAVIDAQRPPPAGTVFYAVPQGAADKEDFAIDFGSPDLNVRVQNDEGVPTAAHYLNTKTVTLSKGESIGFRAMIVAPFYDIDIDYHLEFSFDDSSIVRVYNSDGKPFRVISYPSQSKRGYITAKDGPDNSQADNFAIYPCTWPTECRNNVFGSWPYEE